MNASNRIDLVRQGDVYVARLPDSAKLSEKARPERPEDGRVVLAHGEVTGHAHALPSSICSLYAADAGVIEGDEIQELISKIGGGEVARRSNAQRDIFESALAENPMPAGAKVLAVREPTALKHEEHSPIDLKEGLYLTWRQREYDPESDRLVAD